MSDLTKGLQAFAQGVGTGLENFATHSARAAAAANGASAQGQATAMNFNAGQATNANNINANTMQQQYGFNSGQAAIANQFTQASWEEAAAWNERMFEKQMEFNAEQARLNREWQERMDSTKYQRAMQDMKSGGLNPVLAAGGVSVGGGGGGAASVSSPTMGAMSGHAGSGGLLGADSASVGGYSGQMEYMGGMLGLLSAAIQGMSSAATAWANMGVEDNKTFIGLMKDIFLGQETMESDKTGHGQRGRGYEQAKPKGFKSILETIK